MISHTRLSLRVTGRGYIYIYLYYFGKLWVSTERRSSVLRWCTWQCTGKSNPYFPRGMQPWKRRAWDASSGCAAKVRQAYNTLVAWKKSNKFLFSCGHFCCTAALPPHHDTVQNLRTWKVHKERGSSWQHCSLRGNTQQRAGVQRNKKGFHRLAQRKSVLNAHTCQKNIFFASPIYGPLYIYNPNLGASSIDVARVQQCTPLLSTQHAQNYVPAKGEKVVKNQVEVHVWWSEN